MGEGGEDGKGEGKGLERRKEKRQGIEGKV